MTYLRLACEGSFFCFSPIHVGHKEKVLAYAFRYTAVSSAEIGVLDFGCFLRGSPNTLLQLY